MYAYFGFGLHIASELEFPELMPSNASEADINIEVGDIPEALMQGRDVQKAFLEWTTDAFLLNIPSVGKFLAQHGNYIRAQINPGANLNTFRIYLLSNALTAVLVQRKMVLLHASAIVHEDTLVLFMGRSGAGKSSLAAEFRKNGLAVFSDDVCVLQPSRNEEQECFAMASYPMMKLWKNSIEAIGDALNNEEHRLFPDAEKFGQFFHDRFYASPLPISMVFILNPIEEPTPYAVRRLEGMEAFQALSRNTYRGSFIQEKALQVIHFQSVARLGSQVPVMEITRSLNESDIPSFTRFVFDQIREMKKGNESSQ